MLHNLNENELVPGIKEAVNKYTNTTSNPEDPFHGQVTPDEG